MSAVATHKIEQLAVHLAAGGTVAEFIERTGTPRRTAYRWNARPETRARVVELRGEFVASVAGRLSMAGEKAVATLIDLLDAGTSEGSTRLGAARAILQNLASMSAIAEMRQQLQDLEERFDHAGPRQFTR